MPLYIFIYFLHTDTILHCESMHGYKAYVSSTQLYCLVLRHLVTEAHTWNHNLPKAII